MAMIKTLFYFLKHITYLIAMLLLSLSHPCHPPHFSSSCGPSSSSSCILSASLLFASFSSSSTPLSTSPFLSSPSPFSCLPLFSCRRPQSLKYLNIWWCHGLDPIILTACVPLQLNVFDASCISMTPVLIVTLETAATVIALTSCSYLLLSFFDISSLTCLHAGKND